MRYPGGKGRCYRQIIALMPPHQIYIESHLGGGAVFRAKRPASRSIGIDVDEAVVSSWHGYQGLEVVHADACAYLRRYPFEGHELVYADPPYVASTRRRARVYRFDYTDDQHVELLEVLRTLPCAVIVSGYPSSLYDAMLPEWRKVTFPGDSHAGPRVEVVWLNYPSPALLHAHSFLGGDFRAREVVRRRRDGLLRRIAALDERERQALFERLVADHASALTRALGLPS